MKQIILYGIGGADKQYQALSYFCIFEENISVWSMKREAAAMADKNPSIKAVYALDNRHGLKQDYVESYKKHTIESCAIFKDILEREGLRVI